MRGRGRPERPAGRPRRVAGHAAAPRRGGVGRRVGERERRDAVLGELGSDPGPLGSRRGRDRAHRRQPKPRRRGLPEGDVAMSDRLESPHGPVRPADRRAQVDRARDGRDVEPAGDLGRGQRDRQLRLGRAVALGVLGQRGPERLDGVDLGHARRGQADQALLDAQRRRRRRRGSGLGRRLGPERRRRGRRRRGPRRRLGRLGWRLRGLGWRLRGLGWRLRRLGLRLSRLGWRLRGLGLWPCGLGLRLSRLGWRLRWLGLWPCGLGGRRRQPGRRRGIDRHHLESGRVALGPHQLRDREQGVVRRRGGVLEGDRDAVEDQCRRALDLAVLDGLVLKADVLHVAARGNHCVDTAWLVEGEAPRVAVERQTRLEHEAVPVALHLESSDDHAQADRLAQVLDRGLQRVLEMLDVLGRHPQAVEYLDAPRSHGLIPSPRRTPGRRSRATPCRARAT